MRVLQTFPCVPCPGETEELHGSLSSYEGINSRRDYSISAAVELINNPGLIPHSLDAPAALARPGSRKPRDRGSGEAEKRSRGIWELLSGHRIDFIGADRRSADTHPLRDA